MAEPLDVAELARIRCEQCLTGELGARVKAEGRLTDGSLLRAVEFTHTEPTCEAWNDNSQRAACFPDWLRGRAT